MTNYIPLRSILGKIPKSLFKESSESDFLSWALEALRTLPSTSRTEAAVKILEIKNNKVALPKELKYINLITYMAKEPDEKSCSSLASCVESPEAEEEWYNNTERICRYTLNYKLFLDSLYYNQNYMPLRYVGNSPFVSKRSPNIGCNCAYTYTVDANKCLHTSLCEGFLCIDYQTEIKDENGDFLIPDYQEVSNYLSKYAIMKHWEERASSKEEGTFTLYQKYQQEAESQRKAAKGRILLSNTDLHTIANVVGNTYQKLIKVPEYYFYAR